MKWIILISFENWRITLLKSQVHISLHNFCQIACIGMVDSSNESQKDVFVRMVKVETRKFIFSLYSLYSLVSAIFTLRVRDGAISCIEL